MSIKQQITKKAIQSSFLKLLETKPFDKITIRDIVDDCGLTRNAFYYHYDDVFDVVDEVFGSRIQTIINAAGDSVSLADYLTHIADFAMDNKKIITHLLTTNYRAELSVYINRSLGTVLMSFIRRRAGDRISQQEITVLCDCCKYAVLGFLEEYLYSGMSVAAQSDIALIGRLLDGMIDSAIERSPEAAADNK